MGAVTGPTGRWFIQWKLIGKPMTVEVIDPRRGDARYDQWQRGQNLLLFRFQIEEQQGFIARHLCAIIRAAPLDEPFNLQVCGYTAALLKI